MSVVSVPKRVQHRPRPLLKDIFKQANRRWALAIAMAFQHGDYVFGTRLIDIHPDKDFKRFLR